MTDRIRVLVADDSPFVCRLLTSYLEASSDFTVVASAHDGRQVLEKTRALKPDVITLDLEMPDVDGLEALSRIMRECPVPVVVVSGVSGRTATRTLQALDLGAVDFVLKYAPGANVHPDELRREILSKLRAASKIRVVRSVSALDSTARPVETGALQDAAANSIVVVIGASTGGPVALRELLSTLPPGFPARIVVVQHMPRNFTAVLAAQLDRNCRLRVREADDGDRAEPGTVLVAPGGYHLMLRPGFRVSTHAAEVAGGHCPSIDTAMESAARIYGSRTFGIVLTGMGADGALGLQAIRDNGGVTFAQDAESSVVDGMPRRARERGCVDFVGEPARLAQLLINETEKRTTHAA